MKTAEWRSLAPPSKKKKKKSPSEQGVNAARAFSVLSPLSCVAKCKRELNAVSVFSQVPTFRPTDCIFEIRVNLGTFHMHLERIKMSLTLEGGGLASR